MTDSEKFVREISYKAYSVNCPVFEQQGTYAWHTFCYLSSANYGSPYFSGYSLVSEKDAWEKLHNILLKEMLRKLEL